MPDNNPEIYDIREGWRAIHRRLLRHSDMKLAEKEVLRNLLDRMGKGDICFPSQATIAWDCNLSRGHVNESLKALEARGFITKMPRQRRQSLSYHMNGRALLDWAETEPEAYPLDAISETDIPTVGNSDDKKSLLSDNLTGGVRLSDSACKNFLHPEVTPVSKLHRSEPSLATSAPKGMRVKVWAKPMTADKLAILKERFAHLDVEEEIAFAMDHEARFKSSDEYLYLLKWLKNARGNFSPKFSSNSEPKKTEAQGRDDWGMTPEQWREAILAAGGDLD